LSDLLIIMLGGHINVTKIADDSGSPSYPQMRDSRALFNLGSEESKV
jgi:hypothetical protein